MEAGDARVANPLDTVHHEIDSDLWSQCPLNLPMIGEKVVLEEKPAIHMMDLQ